MKYAHVLMAVHEELWAMREDKLQAILDFLDAQAEGTKFSSSEIEARIGQRTERQVAQADGDVVVLPLHGVIANRMSMFDDISGGTSSEAFARSFQMALRSSTAKAIIIDANTPGGAVSGSAELSEMVFKARGTKPIIAHVNATCASAGYWICSAADEIVVTPTGSVGSIGVLAVHTDVSGALEQAGVKKSIIKAGTLKAEGNPYGPLSEDARGRIQASVDAAYDMFVSDVARNRGASVEAVRNGFGRGGMVDAADAVKQGMADRVGTLEETLQRFGVTLYGGAVNSAPSARGRSTRRALLDL
ncbi:Signal peptide peptidase A (SppA), a serine protea se [Devosia sp. DBB001]|nr:Signal peptide peptidase A (SppA), a serine protea se [Devosia sp. DBB001]